MTWIVFLASALLSAVAAAGALGPLRRSRSPALERLVDPLEDERTGLLRTLKNLDDEHATGQLSDATYRSLRHETEARAVAVLRALEVRGDAGEPTSLRELRSRRVASGPDGDPAPMPGRRRSLAFALAGGGVVVAVVALVLAGSIHRRSSGGPITGTAQGGLSFFEQRVADHPDDVAARLDLAQRYLETGDAQSAVQQYVAVLQLAPRNPEAHAQLGFLLYQAGRASDGLAAVRQALDLDPTYPEALYFEGVILLKGLDRPSEAVEPLTAYLAAAPFGAHREEVQQLLEEARAGAG
jgi:tetratricopeptide (TPR) repeat protein